eukprot:g2445.t1
MFGPIASLNLVMLCLLGINTEIDQAAVSKTKGKDDYVYKPVFVHKQECAELYEFITTDSVPGYEAGDIIAMSRCNSQFSYLESMNVLSAFSGDRLSSELALMCFDWLRIVHKAHVVEVTNVGGSAGALSYSRAAFKSGFRLCNEVGGQRGQPFREMKDSDLDAKEKAYWIARGKKAAHTIQFFDPIAEAVRTAERHRAEPKLRQHEGEDDYWAMREANRHTDDAPDKASEKYRSVYEAFGDGVHSIASALSTGASSAASFINDKFDSAMLKKKQIYAAIADKDESH